MKISPLRTSAARLALGYGAIFTLGVGALLGTVYFLTMTVIRQRRRRSHLRGARGPDG